MRAKPLAVLRYLLEHPGQVVTRAELLKHVWAGIYVTKTALRVCLREIRLALGDEASAPQFIETVGRQGYRFIGQVRELEARDQLSVVSHQGLAPAPWHEAPHFVGREQELAQLRRWFESALAGHLHLVFVTGEAGIGKTVLVTTFLHRVQESGPVWIAPGQCIEQYGVGAPYLPLLDALGRLWQQQGKQEAARYMLAEIYNWFTKGFDTEDLQTAWTLLTEWSASS